jgi:ribosomal protection tetracycline resistance protein
LLRRTLNLGILAHVDAGKTTLTERLLHAAGVIDELGSVDRGTTQTDFLVLERERGITIKSAVVSFPIGELTVNLIDTPGHPDFIAEVERVLSVLDGVVLVVSAVEGVQAQTRVLMRALRRLRLPTLIFVNKTDRRGADPARVLQDIVERLAPAAVPAPRGGDVSPRVVDVLADHDDAFAVAYLENEASISPRRICEELAAQTGRALVQPVFFGSAKTGEGVDALTGGIEEFLPPAARDTNAPLCASVFKIERGPVGEKVAYARIFSGTVRVRDRIGEAKVTAISVFDHGGAVRRTAADAGEICKLWGLDDVQIGDAIGAPWPQAGAQAAFARPTLESIVVAASPSEKGALHHALTQLAEQDPLIDLHRVGPERELAVSLYGEVQKEVVQATLANDFGLDVAFRETTTIHIERPCRTGEAVELLSMNGSTPFLAGVGLRVEAAPTDSGLVYGLEVELGSMPFSFFRTIEETVRETLQQGLHGWQVTDCAVTLVYCGYYPRQSHAHQGFDKSMSSTAGDFRNLTPLVLMEALQQAGTTVYAPLHRVVVEFPADAVAAVLSALARLEAVAEPPEVRGPLTTVAAVLPAGRVHEFQLLLPALTRGEGVLESAFASYRKVAGAPPSRARSDANPLDREQYLLHTAGRIGR